jgi:Fur family zinc uptake transcriptional regulator
MTATHDHPKLTRNQSLVYTALSDAPGPLSAYTILDNLRGEGLRAPLQIYRALDKLLEIGLVHRLESLNAFVACHHGHGEHDAAVFAICAHCGKVLELSDDATIHRLDTLARNNDFAVAKTTIELRGRCAACAA